MGDIPRAGMARGTGWDAVATGATAQTNTRRRPHLTECLAHVYERRVPRKPYKARMQCCRGPGLVPGVRQLIGRGRMLPVGCRWDVQSLAAISAVAWLILRDYSGRARRWLVWPLERPSWAVAVAEHCHVLQRLSPAPEGGAFSSEPPGVRVLQVGHRHPVRRGPRSESSPGIRMAGTRKSNHLRHAPGPSGERDGPVRGASQREAGR